MKTILKSLIILSSFGMLNAQYYPQGYYPGQPMYIAQPAPAGQPQQVPGGQIVYPAPYPGGQQVMYYPAVLPVAPGHQVAAPAIPQPAPVAQPAARPGQPAARPGQPAPRQPAAVAAPALYPVVYNAPAPRQVPQVEKKTAVPEYAVYDAVMRGDVNAVQHAIKMGKM